MSHMMVQQEGTALRFLENREERVLVSGSSLVPNHTLLQFPFTKLGLITSVSPEPRTASGTQKALKRMTLE